MASVRDWPANWAICVVMIKSTALVYTFAVCRNVGAAIGPAVTVSSSAPATMVTGPRNTAVRNASGADQKENDRGT